MKHIWIWRRKAQKFESCAEENQRNIPTLEIIIISQMFSSEWWNKWRGMYYKLHTSPSELVNLKEKFQGSRQWEWILEGFRNPHPLISERKKKFYARKQCLFACGSQMHKTFGDGEVPRLWVNEWVLLQVY